MHYSVRVAAACGLLLAPALALAVGKTVAPEPAGGGIYQVLFGLVVVLGAIGVAAWMLRRFGNLQTSAGGALRVLGGLPLGTRERAVLIQVGDTQILVGVAPGRVQTLHVLERPVPAAAAAVPAAASFSERLAQAIKGVRRD